MSSNTTAVYDYEGSNDNSEFILQNKYIREIRNIYITGYLIVCTLGLVLNLLVIIVGIRWHHRSVTARWVVALALTHLVCSAFLPFQILYSWNYFNWYYGTALCKVSSYVFYVSLFSTAGILNSWSVTDAIGIDKCKGRLCTTCQHSILVMIMIMSSWTLAVILSLPSLFSRELRYTALGQECIDDYDFDDDKMTEDGKTKLTVVVCYRFILGILTPVLLVGISRCCQRYEIKKKNLMRITCLIKVAFFVCWTPLLIMGLLQAIPQSLDRSTYGLPVGTVLAAAHCCVNPVIYLLVSHDIKMQWMKEEQESDQSTNAYI